LGYFKHGEEELEDLSFHRDGNKGVKLPYIHVPACGRILNTRSNWRPKVKNSF